MTIELQATTPSGRPIVAALTREFPAIDYGVVGDGARDDWGPLKEALQAAAGQGGGRVLMPPACTVMTSRRVDIPAGVELFLPWSTVLTLMAGMNVDVVGMDGAGAALTGGGTVDGNRLNQTSGLGYGVNVHGSNCLVEDVRVTNTRGAGVILNTTSGCELRGLTVENVGGNGIEVWKADRCLIQGAICRDVGRALAAYAGDGVQLIQQSSYNVITGVTLSDSAGAAGTSGYAVRENPASWSGDWNVLAAVAAGPGCIWSHQIIGAHSGFQAANGAGNSSGALSLLTNGGMEVWQRGNGPFVAAAAYGPDRWQLALAGGSTLSVSRVAPDAGQGSQWAAGFTYVHTGGGSAYLAQKVDGWQQLAGRQVAFQAFVKASVIGAVRLVVFDGTSSTGSFANQGTTGESLNVVASLPAGATTCEVRIVFDVAGVTGYADSVTLVCGPTPAYFTPMPPGEDLLRCQRYYQEYGGLLATELIVAMQVVTTTLAVGVITLPVEMALTPTVTVSANADWAVLDTTGQRRVCSAFVFNPTRKSVWIEATSTTLVAGQASILSANTTLNARLRLVANP